MERNGKQYTTRRRVIGAIGALSATGLSGVAGASQAEPTDAVVLTGSYNSPLSDDEIHEARRSVAGPDVMRTEYGSRDGKVVAVATVATDGPIRQFVGIAGSRDDVAEAHRGAREAVDRYRQESVGTMAHDGDGWSTYEDSDLVTYQDPYGELVDNYTMYHDDYDYWTIHDRHVMTPGIVKYDSNYYNNDSNTKQSWSEYDNTTKMDDWEPLDGTSANTTYSAEVTAAADPSVTFGWSFTTADTHVDDLSVYSENFAEFGVDYSGSSTDSTAGFEPGSLAEYISRDAYDFNHMLNLDSEGRFTHTWGNTEKLSHYVNFFF